MLMSGFFRLAVLRLQLILLAGTEGPRANVNRLCIFDLEEVPAKGLANRGGSSGAGSLFLAVNCNLILALLKWSPYRRKKQSAAGSKPLRSGRSCTPSCRASVAIR